MRITFLLFSYIYPFNFFLSNIKGKLMKIIRDERAKYPLPYNLYLCLLVYYLLHSRTREPVLLEKFS